MRKPEGGVTPAGRCFVWPPVIRAENREGPLKAGLFSRLFGRFWRTQKGWVGGVRSQCGAPIVPL